MGVVILGGAHGTLALARTLGAQRIPVWLISDDTPLPRWSRFVSRRLAWCGAEDSTASDSLLDIAQRYGLKDFLLVPAGDAEVRLVSKHRSRLSGAYRILLPDWEVLQWVCEKPLLYRRARELDLNVPKTYDFSPERGPAAEEITFPVILKPHMGVGDGNFIKAKVVRADDQQSFLAAYLGAADEIGRENVVVQEFIPGDGKNQFSYAALWHDGTPLAEFTSRRTRQYPIEFGYTSTFVEVVDEPSATAAARTLLTSIRHTGLVEIEFKRDMRDNTLKLLDVNPRPWSWFGLCRAAGLDLGGMLWTLANGGRVLPTKVQPNTRWMYLVRDAIAAAELVLEGRLTMGEYIRSFSAIPSWAAFAADDPLPGLIDLPLTAWRVLTRRLLKID